MTEPIVRDIDVLLVEDDPEVREAIGDILTFGGFSVELSRDGADALERLKSVRPKLILLDLNMPVMSGAAFRAVQREDPVLRTIPTYLLTASDRATSSSEELGATGALRKPVTMAQLLAVVKKHVSPA